MLFAMEGLTQLEEIIQTEELADSLPDTATSYQMSGCIGYEEQLVHIIHRHQAMGSTHAC